MNEAVDVAQTEAASLSGQAAQSRSAKCCPDIASIEVDEALRDVSIEKTSGGAVVYFARKGAEAVEYDARLVGLGNFAEAGFREQNGARLDVDEGPARI
jgi:hypothetical protein